MEDDQADRFPPDVRKTLAEELQIIKAFALQAGLVKTLPSESIEQMATLSLLSWGGEVVHCTIRFPVLRDLRDAIDQCLAKEEPL
jgi:hypothetical protein